MEIFTRPILCLYTPQRASYYRRPVSSFSKPTFLFGHPAVATNVGVKNSDCVDVNVKIPDQQSSSDSIGVTLLVQRLLLLHLHTFCTRWGFQTTKHQRTYGDHAYRSSCVRCFAAGPPVEGAKDQRTKGAANLSW